MRNVKDKFDGGTVVMLEIKRKWKCDSTPCFV